MTSSLGQKHWLRAESTVENTSKTPRASNLKTSNKKAVGALPGKQILVCTALGSTSHRQNVAGYEPGLGYESENTLASDGGWFCVQRDSSYYFFFLLG